MLVSRFGWAGPVLGVLLGLGLLALGEKAAAQEGEPPPTYMGSDVCGLCHETQYDEWYGHGHAWMQLHTAGQPPEKWGIHPGTEQVAAFFDKYPDIHVPHIAEYGGGKIGWGDVQDIMGHFRDGEGYLLLTDGRRATNSSASLSTMPANCNQCHNTGFVAPPSPDTASPRGARRRARVLRGDQWGVPDPGRLGLERHSLRAVSRDGFGTWPGRTTI